MKKNKKICVVGASGLVGSSIVRYALEKGYFVNGTLRDKSDITKVKYLNKLPNSNNLELYNAKMENLKTCWYDGWYNQTLIRLKTQKNPKNRNS